MAALDLDGAADRTGLMDRCARALDLPGWSGRNRDALADSPADHTVRPEGAVERGLLIVVDGRLPCATARPGEWATAREVFAGAVRRTPALTVAPHPRRFLPATRRPAWTIAPARAIRSSWDNEVRALPPG
ncbi:barstar family protein [Streptomyces sp. P9-A2]|uniref:barstar family protein n=1 Tax=Streptomyces sp. P9-A2 TaxID=3072284 RepID=UPI003FCE0A60